MRSSHRSQVTISKFREDWSFQRISTRSLLSFENDGEEARVSEEKWLAKMEDKRSHTWMNEDKYILEEMAIQRVAVMSGKTVSMPTSTSRPHKKSRFYKNARTSKVFLSYRQIRAIWWSKRSSTNLGAIGAARKLKVQRCSKLKLLISPSFHSLSHNPNEALFRAISGEEAL